MSDKKSSGSQSLRTRSHASGSLSSRRSRGSSTSAAAALARAEAQAAKAEAAFAGQESQIKMEQARLEASLKVEKTRLEVSLDARQLEKRTAAAVAKAEALEAAMEEQSEHHSSKIDLQTHDPAERTKEYVDEQAKHVTYQPTHAPEGVSTGSASQQATVVQSTYKATELEDKPSHSRERVSVVGSQTGRTDAHISHSSGQKASESVECKGSYGFHESH